MTAPSPPPPPHQDSITHTDPMRVTMLEHVTTLVATLDRRFDTSHHDLKDSITDRLQAERDLTDTRFRDSELRYQQRFDAQTKALEAALLAQQAATQAALIAQEKAVTKAETANEKRFDSVNEFRSSLNDLIRLQMPRAEAESRLKGIMDKIEDLKTSATMGAGKSAGLNSGWGYLLGAVGLLGAVIALLAGGNNG